MTELVVAVQISIDVPSGPLTYGVSASSSVPLAGTLAAASSVQIVNSAQLQVSSGTPTTNTATGLIEQQVLVTNNTGGDVSAFRLLVATLTEGVVHENPTDSWGASAL